MALVNAVSNETKTIEFFCHDAAANNPALLAQLHTPECRTLLDLAATRSGTILFDTSDASVSEFASAAFKAQEILAKRTDVLNPITKHDIKQDVLHHVNLPNILPGVHYHLRPGASLRTGKNVMLTHQFKDHYLSVADNAGVGGLSIAYQLTTNPNDATLRNAMNSYVQYKADYGQRRTLKRNAHRQLVDACRDAAPASVATQKARSLYPQIYSAGILDGSDGLLRDDTPGGMTGQLLEYKGEENTVESRKRVKNVAPTFSPLMQMKWQVIVRLSSTSSSTRARR